MSVISVWYNQAHYVQRFVSALARQTLREFELIFVDDGSSDGFADARDAACGGVGFDWVSVSRPDRGFTLNTSRNYGLVVARADRVVLVDGDMLPSERLLEKHCANLDRGTHCSVGSRIRAPHLGVASDERYHIFRDGTWSVKPYLYAFGCNLGLDRRFLIANGLVFDESFDGQYGLDDIDLAYRCYKAGGIFVYDIYASATHLPVDYPDVERLKQSSHNFDRFRKYHFVTGIVQSGPVFFEHKYNASLYGRMIGGDVNTPTHVSRIKVARPPAKGGPVVKEIGHGRPAFIVAEAGLNHNGNLEIAKRMVQVAALSGTDCIKFQKRDVDQMATREVYDTTPSPFPELGESYREVRERLELSFEAFAILKELSEELGLVFMITPFDLPSVEFCERLSVPCYKIASHCMTDIPTLKRVTETRKPLFLSTGMSTVEEMDIAVRTVREVHEDLILMHCVSSYPQKDEDTNLALLDYLQDRYQCLVGYSGHEEGTTITAAAVARNAVAVERHFTLDKKMLGFDHSFSLSPQELLTLCQDIRSVEKAIGIPEKRVLACEVLARQNYRRSLVTTRALQTGHVLQESDLTVKEPGTGIPPYSLESVIGKTLASDVPADTTLEATHLAT